MNHAPEPGAPAARRRRLRRLVALAVAVDGVLLVTGGAAWAAYAPIRLDSRDEVFAIPKGTYARRMAGDRVEILPDRITLTLGLNDRLLLRNLDDVPQQFGPVVVMPGQSFRLPFEVASTYGFACSAHASGQMSIVVEPTPAPGLETLRWRLARWRTRLAAMMK